MNIRQILSLATLLFGLNSLTYAAKCEQPETNKENNIAYVADEQGIVYKIDIKNGELLTKYPPIERIGKPSEIDFDRRLKRLYIGSEANASTKSFDPIIVLEIKGACFDVLNRFSVEPFYPLGLTEHKNSIEQNSVYRIRLSPNGKLLYIADAASPAQPITTVLDAETGHIVSRTDLGIVQGYAFSPDGKSIAAIYPSINGGTDGLIAIGDLVQGKWITKKKLNSNIGMNTPWRNESKLLLYMRMPQKILELYDRSSGQLISTIDVLDLTKLNTLEESPVFVEKEKLVVLPMYDNKTQGYVVTIDMLSKQVISQVKLGKWLTNVVVN